MKSFFNIRRWVFRWERAPVRPPWHVDFRTYDTAPQGMTFSSVTLGDPSGLLLLQPSHDAQLLSPLALSATLSSPQTVTVFIHST